jgi:poly-gamma-glutamate synthesis protein (capsule biosynthesis protein)
MLKLAIKIALGVLLLAVIVGAVYLLPGKPITELSVPKASESKDTNILFVGDMFFDRYIRKVAETAGGDYIFSCIYPFLSEADLVVGNLEGPITEHESVSAGTKPGDDGHFQFTFSPETAEVLKRNNVGVVSLGNNHINNFGFTGIASTKKYLDEVGVRYFGGISGDEPVLRKELDGLPVSFVAYNQFGGGKPKEVSEKIRSERQEGRTVIVFAHWGEEYSTSTEGIRETAELFAENGARVIIGSHPHVVLKSEYIRDTLVYYSLGNFIFDQYWNADVSRGLAVLLHISPDLEKRVSVTEYPVILQNDGRTCLAEPPESAKSPTP